MASNRYCIDLAKRGTAACKECKVKIEKGGVRIAKILPNPFNEGVGEMKQWFHVKCIFTKLSRARATTKKIDSSDDLEGWEDIADEHRAEVLKFLDEFSTSGPSKKTSPKTKNKSSNNEDSAEEDEPVPTKDDTLRQFRKVCFEISEVSEYTRKTAVLTQFFKEGCDGKGFKGNLYLWVKMLLPAVEPRVYNLQNKQLIKLFSEMFGAEQEEMLEDFEESGHIDETIAKFFDDSESFPPEKKSTLYLQDVDKFLNELTKTGKDAEQTRILRKVAKKCTSNDLKMFVHFIKHDLRINAGPKHILNAVHPSAYEAFQASRNLKEIIQRCIQQKKTGKDTLKVEASVMTPILPMLAAACGDPKKVFDKFPGGFYVEVKYDGERVQIHKRGNEFSYFSRSLKPVMPHKVAHLKEFIPKAFPHGNNLILDCEILLVDNNGIPLPFGTLGSHKKNAFQDATVCLFVFDCLQFNDESLIKKPLWERRKILEKNMRPVPKHVQFSELKEVKKPSGLAKIITSVISQGLEGLVIKGKDTEYEPGKRHWLKMKKDYLKTLKGASMADTADLVVLGGYYGTGRKGGLMSVFLMGCLDEDTGKWCTVTKVPGGDDDTLERLNDELDMEKITKDLQNVPHWLNINKNLIPDFITKNPKKSPVWAIAGAEFSKAAIHTARGISIRFPRVATLRADKTWKEATTLSELQHIYNESKKTSDLVGLEISDDEENEDENEEGFVFSQPMEVDDNTKESNPESDNENHTSKAAPKTKADDSRGKKTKGTSSEHSKKKPKIEKEESSESDDATSKPKKPKIEKEESPESSNASSKPKKALPEVFRGVKLFIPPSVERFDELKRYFLAYDGTLLKDHQMNEASHVIFPSHTPKDSHPKEAQKVTVDWLWDCIKLQKTLPLKMYKPSS